MIVVDGFGAIFDYDVMWQSSSRKCYPVRRDSASINLYVTEWENIYDYEPSKPLAFKN